MDLVLISAAEIAKCYGTNCTKRALHNHLDRDIRPNVRAIQDALARGDDPKDLTMIEGVRDGKIGKGQTTYHYISCTRCTFFLPSNAWSFLSLELVLIISTEIIKHYGSHCTKNGLELHFRRDLTPNVRLLKQAVANGQDAKDVALIEGVRTGTTGKGQTDHRFLLCILHVLFLSISLSYYVSLEIGIDPVAEMARCYDSQLKPGTLTQHFHRNIKPNAKLIQDALARGDNPMGVALVGNVREDGGGRKS